MILGPDTQGWGSSDRAGTRGDVNKASVSVAWGLYAWAGNNMRCIYVLQSMCSNILRDAFVSQRFYQDVSCDSCGYSSWAPGPPAPFLCPSEGGTFAALHQGVSHRFRVSVPARSHSFLGGSPREAQARVTATRESRSRSPPQREQAQMGGRKVASGTGSVRSSSGQSRPGPPGTRGFR
ncbi:hypothetical protein NDU88_003861 [Pleurodeles waltl]|uniref:Uncharacterized protein n=1 Tax=Pleurodeles waltl TaxID=8319 RepID=A0AAV7UHL0_PLEWA|nr:hypothetical protein NDU88_003861 [Pleurodeles waltl]